MQTITSPLLFLLLFLAAFPPALFASDKNAAAQAEARLRETLRNTMLQLRAAQAETATVQATLAESENEKTALKAQLEKSSKQMDELIKQSKADKTATDKTMEGLNTQLTERDGQITRLTEALEKWKTGYHQAADLARTKEGERAKLATEIILLQRRLDDRETKNATLFKLGQEILTRYEKFSLGDALLAKEPFVGTSRAKLETLVQDYQDKLLDHKIKAGDSIP